MSDAEHLIRLLDRAFPARTTASVEAWVDETARMRLDFSRRRAEERERAAPLFRAIREGKL